MTSDRIKEIQETTAYPESVSVMLALKRVWNECEQEKSFSVEDMYKAIDMARTISHVECVGDNDHRIRYSHDEDTIVNNIKNKLL